MKMQRSRVWSFENAYQLALKFEGSMTIHRPIRWDLKPWDSLSLSSSNVPQESYIVSRASVSNKGSNIPTSFEVYKVKTPITDVTKKLSHNMVEKVTLLPCIQIVLYYDQEPE